VRARARASRSGPWPARVHLPCPIGEVDDPACCGRDEAAPGHRRVGRLARARAEDESEEEQIGRKRAVRLALDPESSPSTSRHV